MKRSIEDIVKAADRLSGLKSYLKHRTAPFAVVFIDLAGSTKLKAAVPQEEWLPIICRFLLCVSECVEENRGTVIKYIGDEVLAVYSDQDAKIATSRCEQCIRECDKKLRVLGHKYQAKFAADFGSAASVDFPNAAGDVLGTCVDRCARISKIAAPGTVVASKQFVAESVNKSNWKRIGHFPLKGFREPQHVFQLADFGNPIKIADPILYMASNEDLVAEVLKLRIDLKHSWESLKIERRKSKIRV